MTQYFFVDESGDAGLNNSQGSAYYVVAMTQLPNREPVVELAALRKELNLSPNFEFHFLQDEFKTEKRILSSYSSDFFSCACGNIDQVSSSI